MTTCCGDYHYADCPLLTDSASSVFDRDWWDDDLRPEAFDHDDPEPYDGCCTSGDVDGIGHDGWGTCMHCGENVYVEELDEREQKDA